MDIKEKAVETLRRLKEAGKEFWYFTPILELPKEYFTAPDGLGFTEEQYEKMRKEAEIQAQHQK